MEWFIIYLVIDPPFLPFIFLIQFHHNQTDYPED